MVSALFFVLAVASNWAIPSAEKAIYDHTRQRCTDFDYYLGKMITHRPERSLHSSMALIATLDIGRLSKSVRAELPGGNWDSQQETEVFRRIASKRPAVLIIDKPENTLNMENIKSDPWPCPVWMPSSAESFKIDPTVQNTTLNANGLRYFPWSYRQDEDQRIRKVDLAIWKSGKWVPTLPFALYCHHLGVLESDVNFSDHSIRIPNQKGIPVINKEGHLSYEFNGYPLWEDTDDSYEMDLLSPTPIQSLLGSYGAAFDKLVPQRYIFAGDFTQTASLERLTSFGKYRDFQLLAVTFDSLLKQYSRTWLTGLPLAFAFLLWNLITYRLVTRASSLTRLAVMAIGLAQLRVLATPFLFWMNVFYWPLVPDLICLAGYTFASATGMWSRSLGMLSYFGGEAARSAGALAARSKFFDEIDDREATILFINLPEHLKLLERINSVELFNRRKEFSTMVTLVSNKYGGIIHDYQADALMIGFGTNVQHRDPEHAIHAVQAAKSIHAEFQELYSNWLEATEPENLKMYAGLCTGDVAVGFVGARKYKQAPAAIGDTTNVAARLMGSAKKQSIDIVASKKTRERCGDRIEVEELAAVQLKGKTSLVEIFHVINIKGPNP